MAKMIPLELRDGEYLSDGEKEIFETLKLGLSDDWLVIYSLRWITDDDVYLGKSNGESDFILINKNYGILILEVKGGAISCINGEWSTVSYNNKKSIIKDPEKQANTSKFNLLSRFKRGNLNPYITTAVWFPDCIKERCSLPLSMSNEIILDMTSFNNIEENIVNIFKYRLQKEGFLTSKMSDSDFKKVVDILNPKIEVKIPLLRLANKLNMKFMKLNEEQNTFFQQLDGNKFIVVNGHAGTGKTVLAVKKALRDAKEGKKVLLLCFNSLLRENIEKESDGSFKVSSIYSLAAEYLKNYNNNLYKKFDEIVSYEEMMKDFLNEVKKNRNKHKLYFDSIIIDEGQDFTEEWFNSIKKLLDSEGSMCVFYDKNQMLYNKYGRNNISFLNSGTKFTLMRNMRNTDEICTSSLKVINAEKETIKLNGVRGIEPDLLFSEDPFDTLNHLKNTIRELKKVECLKDENITVLTMEARKKVKFKTGVQEEFSGRVESIRRFKGLESDVVIIPDLSYNFLEDEDLRKLLYVGMSRAKSHVILIIDTEALNRKQRKSYKEELREAIL